MKPLITILLIMTVLSAHAQSTNRGDIYNPRHNNSVLASLLHMSVPHTAMKTTTTLERVIAQSTREYITAPDTLTDSVKLVYSATRHSSYDYNVMLYPYNYPYGNTPMFNFNGTFTTPQVLYDSMWHWMVAAPATGPLKYGLYERMYGSYNAGSNLNSLYDLYTDSVNFQNMSYINTFDAFGNITMGYWFNLIAGSPDSAYKQYFTYNGSHKLSQDSVYIKRSGVWSIVARSIYTYDGSGNLTQIDTYADSTTPLREKLKYVNTFDGSGRLLTTLVSEFDGTTLSVYEKDTFTYAGATTFFNTSKQYRWDGVNHYFAATTAVSKHLNASLLPDTVYNSSFDSVSNTWVPQDKYTMSYNSYNHPVTLKDYAYTGTTYSSTPSYITTYYYEQYTNAAVSHVASNNEHILLYPNPTSNKFFIAQLSLPANSPLTIDVYNTAGQLVTTMHSYWLNKEIEIPIGDLAPGVYAVFINGVNNTIYNKTIVKQ